MSNKIFVCLTAILLFAVPAAAQPGDDRRSTGERAADALEGWIGGERPPERYGDRARMDTLNDAQRRCQEINPRRPDFNIRGVYPSGREAEVSGTLEGECIDEAGYYEDGRLRERISFPFADRMERRDFRVRIDPNSRGELRAYTKGGEREVLPVDDIMRRR